jgi:8-oxo-dGTP diphosphatase
MEEHFSGKVATKAIIVKDGKILMTRDNNDAAIWDLPGGRINIGESIETALKREIMEELGVAINVDSLIYSEQLRHTSEGSPHLFLTCKAILTDPAQRFSVPSKELAEVRWVDKNTLSQLKTYDNCMRALNFYFSHN